MPFLRPWNGLPPHDCAPTCSGQLFDSAASALAKLLSESQTRSGALSEQPQSADGLQRTVGSREPESKGRKG